MSAELGEDEVLGEEEELVLEAPAPIRCKNLKVLVTSTCIPNEALDLLRESCEVHFLPPQADSSLFLRYCQCMDGLLLDNPTLSLDREFFRGAALGLKVVSVVGWHGKQVDYREAEKRKVKIGVCPTELSVDSTAEVAVGTVLMLCRRMKEGNNALARGIVDPQDPKWLLGTELKDCTCGIIGLGKLGLSIAVRLQPFRPKRLVYYSRRSKRAAEVLSIERLVLNELLESSDVLFLCLPCNNTTRGMFNQALFYKMKRYSFLVNPSNGNLVNVNDLYCALRKGLISGAAMDAELAEAPSARHPIHRLDNFLLLPNVGRSSALVRLRMYIAAVQNIVSGLTLRNMLYPYPPQEDDDFVETEEDRKMRQDEEDRLRLIFEEELRLEMEEQLRLEAEERLADEEDHIAMWEELDNLEEQSVESIPLIEEDIHQEENNED